MQTRSRARNSIGDKSAPAKALNEQLLEVFDATSMDDFKKAAEVRKFADAALAKCHTDSIMLFFAVILACIVVFVIYMVETALYQRFNRENDYYYNESIKGEIKAFMALCGVMMIMLCAAINKARS
jgi:hypothetical protein